MNELEILQKQVKLAEESKACAWENNGILERARQKQEATIAELRERHEAFVRKVCSEAQRAADLATCTSLTSYLANEILALCGAELSGEQSNGQRQRIGLPPYRR